MFALFGSIAGFLTSFIPEIFNFLKDRKDKAHELALIRLQIEASAASSSGKLEEVQINADLEESRLLHGSSAGGGACDAKVKNPKKRILWVETLSASVRPVITYTFFLVYISVKLVILFGYNQCIAIPLWTDEDQAIFCAVIGFWFGHRAFSKSRILGRKYQQ